MVGMIGIYAIENLHNGKIYVGSSHNMQLRRQDHFYLLHKGKHPNIHLQRAWNKYGADVFEFIILDETNDPLTHEQTWIDMARMDGIELYNINLYVGKPPMLGKRHSEEARRKISKSLIGSKRALGHRLSEETKRGISESLKGHERSEESKRKQSKSMMGHTVNEETRQKISEAQMGEKNHLYGKHHSDEAKRKIGEASKRRWKRWRLLIEAGSE